MTRHRGPVVRHDSCPTCRLLVAAEAARILDDAPGGMRIHLEREAERDDVGGFCAQHAGDIRRGEAAERVAARGLDGAGLLARRARMESA